MRDAWFLLIAALLIALFVGLIYAVFYCVDVVAQDFNLSYRSVWASLFLLSVFSGGSSCCSRSK